MDYDKPMEVVYASGDKQMRLQEPWTDIIIGKIWAEQKLLCCFSFHYHCVCNNREMSLHPYIKIQGKCIECNNPLNGECEERPAENLNVIFKIETLDTCGIPHMKKRQLHRTERKNCQDKLINVKALQHYKEVANMEMSFGDRSNTPMFFIVPLETAACHVAAAAATSKTFNTICEWERKRHRAISVIELDPCIVFYAFGSPMNIKQIFFIFIILEIQYFLDIKSLLYWIPIFKNY